MIISSWKGQGPSDEHIWIPSTKDALCQVCYWSSGSGEEDENVKQLQCTTHKFISEKLTWAYGSGELKTVQ